MHRNPSSRWLHGEGGNLPLTRLVLRATILAELGGREQRAGPLGAEGSRLRGQPLPRVVYLVGVGVRTEAEDTPLDVSLRGEGRVLCIFP